MFRSLTAFEGAFDRVAAGYFVVLGLMVAGALVGVTL
ncbi:MAG: hypothetical protein JWP92_1443 [Caulobacter sp.]|jgi:hypothetical protein|nr:hypothetical protein [Caulobacter sp.]